MAAAPAKRAEIAGGSKDLTDSPTNLKEAIDWILRVTGKDGQSNTQCLCLLSEVIHDLVRDVEGYLDEEELEVVRGTLRDLQGVDGTRRISNLVEGVATGLQKFVGWSPSAPGSVEGGSTPSGSTTSEPELTGEGIGDQGPSSSGGSNGTKCEKCKKNKSSKQKCVKYESSYMCSEDGLNKWDQIYDECIEKGSDKEKTAGDLTTLARILLGAIPLVFSGLSYLYWISKQSSNVGGSKLNGGNIQQDTVVVGVFFPLTGFDKAMLAQVNGDKIPEKLKDFKEFSQASDKQPYSEFLGKMLTENQSNKQPPSAPSTPAPSTPAPPSNCLLILYILFTGYFRKLQYTRHQVCYTTSGYKLDRSPTMCGTNSGFTLLKESEPVKKKTPGQPVLPRTIREILYWLTSLPYSPDYKQIQMAMEQFSNRYGGRKFELTGGITLDPNTFINTLRCTCLFAPMLMVCMQTKVMGRNGLADSQQSSGTTTTVEPIIYALYSNSIYRFSITKNPHEALAMLFYYVYNLYQPFYFLYLMGNIKFNAGGGWHDCIYGPGIKCDKCTSFICKVTQSDSTKHAKECGQSLNGTGGTPSPSPSPLQAFLTDCLPGFRCQVMETMEKNKDKLDKGTDTLEYPNIYKHIKSSFNTIHRGCPLPMGFRECFLNGAGSTTGTPAAPATSGATTLPFTRGPTLRVFLLCFSQPNIKNASLYKLLVFLTQVVQMPPSTVGDMFGLYNGLVGNGEGTTPAKPKTGASHEVPKGIKEYITKELPCLPGVHNATEVTTALCLMKGSSHSSSNGHKNNESQSDLTSLSSCGQETHKETCGKYFEPLCGGVYKVGCPEFAENYLVWVVYYTEYFREGLRALLEDFRKINCKESGCLQGGKPAAAAECCNGKDHGTQKDTCKCPTIVQCAGVLPLIYRYGFSFNSPLGLNGKRNGGKNKRECHDFYQQLEKVIKEGPFSKLIAAITHLRYAIRLPFGITITSLWILVIVYLLWSMTVNLDLLHIQSHWKSTSSHMVPVGTLLSNGSRKGFCTLGYFRDAPGDRLLSQGISDVYM